MILKLKRINFTGIEDVDIKNVLVSKKISFGEKAINILLVTCVMIIKLKHCIQCFLKWVHM